jgi:hypothetical protein
VPQPRSDVFATGQTLYVVAFVGLTAQRPEIQHDIDFLVATQKPDGNWPMISRATPDSSPGSAQAPDADELRCQPPTNVGCAVQDSLFCSFFDCFRCCIALQGPQGPLNIGGDRFAFLVNGHTVRGQDLPVF